MLFSYLPIRSSLYTQRRCLTCPSCSASHLICELDGARTSTNSLWFSFNVARMMSLVLFSDGLSSLVDKMPTRHTALALASLLYIISDWSIAHDSRTRLRQRTISVEPELLCKVQDVYDSTRVSSLYRKRDWLRLGREQTRSTVRFSTSLLFLTHHRVCDIHVL